MAYVTLNKGAFNDDTTVGRTVKIEEIEIEPIGDGRKTLHGNYCDRPHVLFTFTWPENPYDMDTVSAIYCRTATESEVEQARADYKNEGARFR